jgi:hypothetical protein
MDFVLYNLRLKELVAIVRENERFYQDFVEFLKGESYNSVLEFIQEPSDEKAAETISVYLSRANEIKLYDGFLRPYSNSKAKWFFLAWLLRDAATQRLQPLLKTMPGETAIERKAYLLNEVRKFVGPLFPQAESWEWPAISEVMLARLEGSRRALKGALFEEIVKIGDETYDVQVTGKTGSVLLPVKTRETMGGGHSLLFTRDIYKSIWVATDSGYSCVPIVIAESWVGDLNDLKSELYIYIQANPNQVAIVEPLLVQQLEELVPVLESIQ